MDNPFETGQPSQDSKSSWLKNFPVLISALALIVNVLGNQLLQNNPAATKALLVATVVILVATAVSPFIATIKNIRGWFSKRATAKLEREKTVRRQLRLENPA